MNLSRSLRCYFVQHKMDRDWYPDTLQPLLDFLPYFFSDIKRVCASSILRGTYEEYVMVAPKLRTFYEPQVKMIMNVFSVRLFLFCSRITNSDFLWHFGDRCIKIPSPRVGEIKYQKSWSFCRAHLLFVSDSVDGCKSFVNFCHKCLAIQFWSWQIDDQENRNSLL